MIVFNSRLHSDYQIPICVVVALAVIQIHSFIHTISVDSSMQVSVVSNFDTPDHEGETEQTGAPRWRQRQRINKTTHEGNMIFFSWLLG